MRLSVCGTACAIGWKRSLRSVLYFFRNINGPAPPALSGGRALLELQRLCIARTSSMLLRSAQGAFLILGPTLTPSPARGRGGEGALRDSLRLGQVGRPEASVLPPLPALVDCQGAVGGPGGVGRHGEPGQAEECHVVIDAPAAEVVPSLFALGLERYAPGS